MINTKLSSYIQTDMEKSNAENVNDLAVKIKQIEDSYLQKN